jgi:hypothetical protein
MPSSKRSASESLTKHRGTCTLHSHLDPQTDYPNLEFLSISYFLADISLQSLSSTSYHSHYRGADKSLARPTSRCILFDGEDISFDARLVIHVYINSNNIPPIMIRNRIYETQNLLSQ